MQRGNIRKFGRVRNQRKALFKSLITALIEHGKIKTTQAKAKALAKYVGPVITKSKIDTVATRRFLGRDFSAKTVNKLIKEIAPTFAGRNGGYTRIIRLNRRKSDSAPMVIIEIIK